MATAVEPACLQWPDLVRLEPRLRDVERMAINLHRSRFREWRDWEAVKSQFVRLVGWYARKRELSTNEAYDVAYTHLLHRWEDGYRP